MSVHPCTGCIYSWIPNADRGAKDPDRTPICLYLLKTGRRRPCQYGAGCTVKVLGKRVGNKWRDIPVSQPSRRPQGVKDDDAVAMKLYMEGLNDRAIGDRLGVSDNAVFNWRKRKGLKANATRGNPKGDVKNGV